MQGRYIRLEPLSIAHHQGLTEVGLDPELWRWTVSQVSTPADMGTYVDSALQAQTEGTALPFATLELASGRVVGSTRFMNIDPPNRHVEIGSTWVAPPWQRTPVNTEAKYLMLRHAFEELNCMRVELKTDSLNKKSRAAILRLGAKEEGIFRNHMVCYGGRIRHTAWYSIIDQEWPGVKANLEARLYSPSNRS